MSATVTRIATLGVSQAPSPRVPGEGLRAAEDRGFEPRRVVTPNRISSVLPVVLGRRRHVRDRTETQARRARKARIARKSAANAGNARRVRARIVRAARQAPDHSASPFPASGAWTRMRSIVVRAMPVRRCTSALLRPAWKAVRITSSRRSVTDCRSDTHAASISRACRTVSSGMHRTLRFCSAYCNRSASPITAREAIRVRSHGSRNGTGRSCFRACRGAGTNPEVEAVMLGLPLNGRSRLPGPRAHRRGPASGRRRDLPPCIRQRSTRRYTAVWCISQCIGSVPFEWNPYQVSARKSAAIRARWPRAAASQAASASSSPNSFSCSVTSCGSVRNAVATRVPTITTRES